MRCSWGILPVPNQPQRSAQDCDDTAHVHGGDIVPVEGGVGGDILDVEEHVAKSLAYASRFMLLEDSTVFLNMMDMDGI